MRLCDFPDLGFQRKTLVSLIVHLICVLSSFPICSPNIAYRKPNCSGQFLTLIKIMTLVLLSQRHPKRLTALLLGSSICQQAQHGPMKKALGSTSNLHQSEAIHPDPQLSSHSPGQHQYGTIHLGPQPKRSYSSIWRNQSPWQGSTPRTPVIDQQHDVNKSRNQLRAMIFLNTPALYNSYICNNTIAKRAATNKDEFLCLSIQTIWVRSRLLQDLI